jgi:hypothetical protein
MHTNTKQTHCQKSRRNKFNTTKAKPDVSAVTRPLTTHLHIKKVEDNTKTQEKV